MTTKNKNISLSYAVTVHNETDTLKELLNTLNVIKDKNDELIILDDFSTNKKTNSIINSCENLIKRKLVHDYAFHKNHFFNFCKGDYIFQIDGDEIPTKNLLNNIKKIIMQNPACDLFWIPRENRIINKSTDFLKKLNFTIDGDGRFLYPDYQGRVYKNKKALRWTKKLHEVIGGAKQQIYLPKNEDLHLIHNKTYEKHKRNNAKYKKFYTKPKFSKNKIGLLTCYFNPCNYISRYNNLCKFSNLIKNDYIDLHIVESFDENTKIRIKKDFKNVISVKNNSWYWKKENLLNIGIKKLLKTKDYDHIICIDSDISFIENNWTETLMETAKKYNFFQIFDTASIPITDTYAETKKSSANYIRNISHEQNLIDLLKRSGEPGFGFGYSTDILNQRLLYENAIVGTGDFLNLIGMSYCKNFKDIIKNDRFFKNLTDSFLDDYCCWCKKRNTNELEPIGFASLNLKSFYHGNIIDRKYIKREDILKTEKFDPVKHLKKKHNGTLEIHHPTLQSKIKKYMISRKEDSNLNELPIKISLSLNSQTKKIISQSFTNLQFEDYSIPNNCKLLLIASKLRNFQFPITRIKVKDKVCIDKSKEPTLGSIVSSHNGGHIETLFRFIYLFYDNLPDRIIFISDILSKTDYINYTNKKIQIYKDVNGYLPFDSYITQTPKKFPTSKYGIKLPRAGTISTKKYNSSLSFFIDSITIKKYPKSFYFNNVNEFVKKRITTSEIEFEYKLGKLFK